MQVRSFRTAAWVLSALSSWGCEGATPSAIGSDPDAGPESGDSTPSRDVTSPPEGDLGERDGTPAVDGPTPVDGPPAFDAAPKPTDLPPKAMDAEPVDGPAPDAASPATCPPASAPPEVPIGGGFSGDAQCGPLSFFAVGARGMRLHLSGRDFPPGAEVFVTDAVGTDLGRERADERGVLSLRVSPVQSGELRWTVATSAESVPGRFQGSLVCEDGCEREATRYPIVLLHGMCGTDRYFGLLEYFFDVPAHLGDRGFAAFTPVVAFIGPSEQRAAELAPQIDQVLAETGAARVHLIAHSQGGIDLRVLVSGLGYADRVASATTVSSPHGGIPIDVPDWLSGQDFSRAGMEDFALRFPDIEGMPIFSWAGRTCGILEAACRRENQDEVVELVIDATHYLMNVAGADDGEEGANDGVVLVSSARWGTFLGLLPADHFDEVGQIADREPAPFDHRAFYLSEARRLRQLELDLEL